MLTSHDWKEMLDVFSGVRSDISEDVNRLLTDIRDAVNWKIREATAKERQEELDEDELINSLAND